jgi:hypothetical protein
MFPILVTQEEFYLAMFVFFQVGLFYTMKNLFLPPHEVENESHH